MGFLADIIVSPTHVTSGDVLVIKKSKKTTEDILVGRFVSTSARDIVLEWFIFEGGIWVEGAYGKETILRTHILAKIKNWPPSGIISEDLKSQIIELYNM